MKKLLSFLLLLMSVVSYSQIVKTGGILYSNGDPNTRGLDTLTLKNLNRNSEVAVDVSTGSMSIFNRADSSYTPLVSRDTILGSSKTKAPSQYAVKKYVDENSGGGDLLPYKVYTAYLNIIDTTNIVATILENTLGTIDWGIAAGTNLYATSSGLFTCGKTFILYSPMADRFSPDEGTGRPGVYITPFSGCEEDDNTYLGFYNKRVDNDDTDYVAQIPKLYIEIRVYD